MFGKLHSSFWHASVRRRLRFYASTPCTVKTLVKDLRRTPHEMQLGPLITQSGSGLYLRLSPPQRLLQWRNGAHARFRFPSPQLPRTLFPLSPFPRLRLSQAAGKMEETPPQESIQSYIYTRPDRNHSESSSVNRRPIQWSDWPVWNRSRKNIAECIFHYDVQRQSFKEGRKQNWKIILTLFGCALIEHIPVYLASVATGNSVEMCPLNTARPPGLRTNSAVDLPPNCSSVTRVHCSNASLCLKSHRTSCHLNLSMGSGKIVLTAFFTIGFWKKPLTPRNNPFPDAMFFPRLASTEVPTIHHRYTKRQRNHEPKIQSNTYIF